MIKKLNPLVAALTTVAFLCTQALGPLPQAAAQTEIRTDALAAVSAFNPIIPTDLGTLETVRQGRGPSIIHIQTAHGNFEAQKKIASILADLKDRYGFKTLFLEGSAFKLDTEMLRFFPNHPRETLEVNEELAQKALVKGPELFLLEARDAEGYGIEELEAYRANVRAFCDVQAAKTRTAQFLETLNRQIERLTAPYLHDELRNFVRRLDTYETAGTPLEIRLNEFKDAAAKHLKIDLSNAAHQLAWPMLVRVFKLRELEKRIDLASYEKEKDRFLSIIDASLLDRVSKLLASPLAEHHLSDPETGLLFEEMARFLPENFNPADYPQVTAAIGHIVLRSEVRGPQLMRELEILTDRILGRLTQTGQEKEIVRLLRDYSLLKKLFALELVPEEYEKIASSAYSLHPSILTRRLGTVNTDGRVRDTAFEHLGDLDFLFDKAMTFYAGTKLRDTKMLERIEKQVAELGIDKAVVVTGGFHAAPFSERFASLGWNYALVSPKVTALGGRNEYLKVITASSTVESVMAGLSPENLAASLPGKDGLMAYLAPELQAVLNKAAENPAAQQALLSDFGDSTPAAAYGVSAIERTTAKAAKQAVRFRLTENGFLNARLGISALSYNVTGRKRQVIVRESAVYAPTPDTEAVPPAMVSLPQEARLAGTADNDARNEIRDQTEKKVPLLYGDYSLTARVSRTAGKPPKYAIEITVTPRGRGKKAPWPVTIPSAVPVSADEAAAQIKERLEAILKTGRVTPNRFQEALATLTWPLPRLSETSAGPATPVPQPAPVIERSPAVQLPINSQLFAVDETLAGWRSRALLRESVNQLKPILDQIMALVPPKTKTARNLLSPAWIGLRFLSTGPSGAEKYYLQLTDAKVRNCFLVLKGGNEAQELKALTQAHLLGANDTVIVLTDVTISVHDKSQGVQIALTPLEFAKIDGLPLKIAAKPLAGGRFKIIAVRDLSVTIEQSRLASGFSRLEVESEAATEIVPSARTIALAVAKELIPQGGAALQEPIASDLLELAIGTVLEGIRSETRNIDSLEQALTPQIEAVNRDGRYQAELIRKQGHLLVKLSDLRVPGTSFTIMADKGFRVISWTVDGKERLAVPEDLNTLGGGIFLMGPFVNRVKDGKIMRNGKSYDISKIEGLSFDGQTGNPIHGIYRIAEWKDFSIRADESGLSITASFETSDYPDPKLEEAFGHSKTTLTFRLDGPNLNAGVRIEAEEGAIADAGLHPFQLYTPGHTTLQAAVDGVFPVDGQKIPTGEPIPLPLEKDFNLPQPVDATLDNTFVIKADADGIVTATITDSAQDVSTTFRMSGIFSAEPGQNAVIHLWGGNKDKYLGVGAIEPVPVTANGPNRQGQTGGSRPFRKGEVRTGNASMTVGPAIAGTRYEDRDEKDRELERALRARARQRFFESAFYHLPRMLGRIVIVAALILVPAWGFGVFSAVREVQRMKAPQVLSTQEEITNQFDIPVQVDPELADAPEALSPIFGALYAAFSSIQFNGAMRLDHIQEIRISPAQARDLDIAAYQRAGFNMPEEMKASKTHVRITLVTDNPYEFKIREAIAALPVRYDDLVLQNLRYDINPRFDFHWQNREILLWARLFGVGTLGVLAGGGVLYLRWMTSGPAMTSRNRTGDLPVLRKAAVRQGRTRPGPRGRHEMREDTSPKHARTAPISRRQMLAYGLTAAAVGAGLATIGIVITRPMLTLEGLREQSTLSEADMKWVLARYDQTQNSGRRIALVNLLGKKWEPWMATPLIERLGREKSFDVRIAMLQLLIAQTKTDEHIPAMLNAIEGIEALLSEQNKQDRLAGIQDFNRMDRSKYYEGWWWRDYFRQAAGTNPEKNFILLNGWLEAKGNLYREKYPEAGTKMLSDKYDTPMMSPETILRDALRNVALLVRRKIATDAMERHEMRADGHSKRKVDHDFDLQPAEPSPEDEDEVADALEDKLLLADMNRQAASHRPRVPSTQPRQPLTRRQVMGLWIGAAVGATVLGTMVGVLTEQQTRPRRFLQSLWKKDSLSKEDFEKLLEFCDASEKDYRYRVDVMDLLKMRWDSWMSIPVIEKLGSDKNVEARVAMLQLLMWKLNSDVYLPDLLKAFEKTELVNGLEGLNTQVWDPHQVINRYEGWWWMDLMSRIGNIRPKENLPLLKKWFEEKTPYYAEKYPNARDIPIPGENPIYDEHGRPVFRIMTPDFIMKSVIDRAERKIRQQEEDERTKRTDEYWRRKIEERLQETRHLNRPQNIVPVSIERSEMRSETFRAKVLEKTLVYPAEGLTLTRLRLLKSAVPQRLLAYLTAMVSPETPPASRLPRKILRKRFASFELIGDWDLEDKFNVPGIEVRFGRSGQQRYVIRLDPDNALLGRYLQEQGANIRQVIDFPADAFYEENRELLSITASRGEMRGSQTVTAAADLENARAMMTLNLDALTAEQIRQYVALLWDANRIPLLDVRVDHPEALEVLRQVLLDTPRRSQREAHERLAVRFMRTDDSVMRWPQMISRLRDSGLIPLLAATPHYVILQLAYFDFVRRRDEVSAFTADLRTASEGTGSEIKILASVFMADDVQNWQTQPANFDGFILPAGARDIDKMFDSKQIPTRTLWGGELESFGSSQAALSKQLAPLRTAAGSIAAGFVVGPASPSSSTLAEHSRWIQQLLPSRREIRNEAPKDINAEAWAEQPEVAYSLAFAQDFTESVLRPGLMSAMEAMGFFVSQPALDVISGFLGWPLVPAAYAAQTESRLDQKLLTPDTRARIDAKAYLESLSRNLRMSPEEVAEALGRGRTVYRPAYADILRDSPEALLNLAQLLENLKPADPSARFLVIMAKRENFLAAAQKTLLARNRLTPMEHREEQVQAIIDLLRNRVDFIEPDDEALGNYIAGGKQKGYGVTVLGDDPSAFPGAVNFRLDPNRVAPRDLDIALPFLGAGGALAASHLRDNVSTAAQLKILPDLLRQIFQGAQFVFRNSQWTLESLGDYLDFVVDAAAVISQSA